MSEEPTTNEEFTEEYTYAEEKYEDDIFPAQKANILTVVKRKVLKQKKLLTIVGVVVILYVVASVFSYIMRINSNNNNLQAPPVVEEPMNRAQWESAPAAKPAREAPRVTEANQEVEKLSGSIANLHTEMYNMHERMQQLGDTVNRLEYALARQMEMQLSQGIQHAEKTGAEDTDNYEIYAIIPNRAWIKTVDGKMLTVAVGSTLPGLGNITAIDSSRGVVVTDTGSIIQFED